MHSIWIGIVRVHSLENLPLHVTKIIQDWCMEFGSMYVRYVCLLIWYISIQTHCTENIQHVKKAFTAPDICNKSLRPNYWRTFLFASPRLPRHAGGGRVWMAQIWCATPRGVWRICPAGEQCRGIYSQWSHLKRALWNRRLKRWSPALFKMSLWEVGLIGRW